MQAQKELKLLKEAKAEITKLKQTEKWWKDYENWLYLPTGLNLHYIEFGPKTGLPIVFCHGWPDFWFTFRHQIQFLGKHGFRTFALDQRGFGFSSGNFPNRQDFQHKYICGDLIAFLDILKIEKTFLVGHDWGGSIVWAIAFHYPEKVLGVAAICTPFFSSSTRKKSTQ